ncbi:uncharacterized protein BXIN_1749 [Babesia sp. Xinjiang]|uniref:uncharacterized protein n=1 Tax=Babesia sp. Xinjiang TaxID=462227 RepID=UPI000A21C947|nr:uncharacterized protein BXIN_1670 [Babesia sp. Xinjiang]XP_028871423.1 uncharacterized protein BXIN_1749 [Babesia sp. Xinjiang]ORM40921.1 hypothetical protein BXIN_1670 [Babesia sp. Xinjiang]ORM40967.1 hypothetical protein BXIN_1749 [Babesia sp. Xinjiang]
MEVHWLTRLFIYCVIATVVGPFYDNWTTMEKWLYREGAYVDLCTDIPQPAPVQVTWHCEEQQVWVSMLLPISRMSECIMSIGIGIFMDFVGPRITTVVGVLLRTIGWILMCFAVRAPGGLVTAFFLLGVSTNFVIFPCLTIGMYTKKYRYIAVLHIGMCSCFSSMLIKLKLILLESGGLTASQINYLYTFLCIVPTLVMCILFMPLKLKEPEEDKEPVRAAEPVTSNEGASVADYSYSDRVGAGLSDTVSYDDIKVCNVDGSVAVPSDDDCTWTLGGFFRVLSSKEVFVCLFYFAFNFSSITYVQQTFSLVHRDDASLLTLNEYMVPLAVVPCLLFAVLYMYWDPIWILIFMNTMGLLMHLLEMTHGRTVGVLLSIALVMAYSILNTQVYNYLESLFHKTYLGSIVGALNGMCGLWMLIQMFVLQYRTSPQEILETSGIMAALRACFLAPFIYFFFSEKSAKSAKNEGRSSHHFT